MERVDGAEGPGQSAGGLPLSRGVTGGGPAREHGKGLIGGVLGDLAADDKGAKLARCAPRIRGSEIEEVERDPSRGGWSTPERRDGAEEERATQRSGGVVPEGVEEARTQSFRVGREEGAKAPRNPFDDPPFGVGAEALQGGPGGVLSGGTGGRSALSKQASGEEASGPLAPRGKFAEEGEPTVAGRDERFSPGER